MKSAFFLRFLDLPGGLRTLRYRATKAEKGEKAGKGQFPGRAARHPLKPPFVTPSFAAALFLVCFFRERPRNSAKISEHFL